MLPLARRSTRFGMRGLRPHNPLWIRFRPSLGNWWTRNGFRPSYRGLLAPLHRSLGFRHVNNGSLLLLLPNQALRSQKAICHSLAHLCLVDDHATSHLASIPRIRPVALFAQGVTLPPHKRRRLIDEDSSDEECKSSTGRPQQDEEEGDEENFRPASLTLLLDYIMNKFPAASKPLAQPSTRRFRVFEAAGLVVESSQRSSNLSWFDHVRFASESTQSKFETKIYEGKSFSTIMPSVSKVEKVSDSPSQGKELKVNSQVYDLMGSKPSDTRSVPMSVRDAAVLEKTLRVL